MKKVFILLLMGIIIYGPVSLDLFSLNESENTLDVLESALAELPSLSHEELYINEVQKIAFRMKQEPYLQFNQRYSRKLLNDAKVSSNVTREMKEENKTISTAHVNKKEVRFHVQRIERSSDGFSQAKIYATVQDHDGAGLQIICDKIREQFNEFNSLVICLYNHNEVGVSLAHGDKTHFSQNEVNDAWLVFYSFHPVEGDYFDDNPGKFLGL